MLTMTYVTYLVLVIFITVSVARTLSKNGAAFLIDGFDGDEALAKSINHLLVVGFYLINLGFALMQLTYRKIETIDTAVLFLSSKIGFVMLVVGVMHLFNLLVISKIKAGKVNRRRAIELEERRLANEALANPTEEMA